MLPIHVPNLSSCKWADVLGVSTPPATDVNFFDINSHSLLVPRLHEQLKATFPEVIKSAWNMAGSVSPERLRYAEVHGSGTPIGDALELEGLTLAMKELGATNHRFTVGSTKGNIGNTQHSSGLVSLIKLCKSIQGGVIPATRGLDTPNPMINPGLPIDLAMQKTPLVESDILAVSAAGWGGVNSHIVLAFPEERLHKKTTTFMPADIFTRQRLEAPRLQRGL